MGGILIFNKIKKHPLILGTILLTGAGIISRILGFFYRIFLSRTIGASGLGLYQLIFPVFTLSLAFSASGIQTAISRFVASEKNGKRFLFSGLAISTVLSGVFTLAIYSFAPWIAQNILKEPRTEKLLQVMAYAILPASVHSCFNGYYYGIKNSSVPSACQIIEQFVRVFGTFFIWNILQNQGLPLEPVHAVWGLVISECSGLLVNITAYFGTVKKEASIPVIQSLESSETIAKTLGLMAIPLTLNHVLITLSQSLENLLLPQKLMAFGYTSDEALEHFGILTGMALSVIFFPSAITNSLSVLLLPRISETKAKGDMTAVLETIKGAVCCGVCLGSLCTFLFLFTADWLGTYIFDNTLAGFYTRILSILCPFMYTSGLLSSIVNGLGNASLTLACNLSGCAIRIIAICLFVPVYGMYAYIISMIVGTVLVTMEFMWVIKKKCI